MKKKKQRKSNIPMRLFGRTLVAILLFGIPIILFITTFQLNQISVIGSTRYTEKQIIDVMIKDPIDSNTLILYMKHKFFTDVTIPFVEKIDLELKDNHTISFQVYEKMVIGCVEFMGEYLYFDKDGIIVESSTRRLEDIPLIEGLKFKKFILNEKLEVQKEELYGVIMNLTQLIDKNELNVNAIKFNRNYEVTLDFGEVKVLLGKKDTYDESLSELKNILKEFSGKKITIDMSSFQRGKEFIIAKPEPSQD